MALESVDDYKLYVFPITVKEWFESRRNFMHYLKQTNGIEFLGYLSTLNGVLVGRRTTYSTTKHLQIANMQGTVITESTKDKSTIALSKSVLRYYLRNSSEVADKMALSPALLTLRTVLGQTCFYADLLALLRVRKGAGMADETQLVEMLGDPICTPQGAEYWRYALELVDVEGVTIQPIKEGKIVSDGGKSDYYLCTLPIDVVTVDQEAGTISFMVEEFIQYCLDNDFDKGTIQKCLVRMGKKAGNTNVYDLNKIDHSTNRLRKVNKCEGT